MSETEETNIPERHFNLDYPNAISLNYSYYENDSYNSIRRCKLILFSHCLGENKSYADIISNTFAQKKYNKTKKVLTNLNIDLSVVRIINNYVHSTCLSKEYITKYLERGCLNRAIEKAKSYNIRGIWTDHKFIDLYHSICYKVACNLDSTSVVESNYILQKILKKEVNIKDVANMTSKELCPKKYEQLDERLSKRTNLEIKVKYSELYRCRKCKQNKTTTERRYNRSLDEGVNLTIHCVYCGHSWLG
jgi:DNA-directed RNA polymerase subunit M/transcription elongation factor TFIIS